MHHGYLYHVIKVLQQIGFQVVTTPNEPNNLNLPVRWDLLWSHEYPFMKSSPLFHKINNPLTAYQKVNHFPGSGFITNKVNLATSGLKFVPKAFNLPREKNNFLQFVSL